MSRNKINNEHVLAYFKKCFPNGDPTPEAVEKLARPKNSPIHDYFTWDDAAAAYQHRLQQARQLIACLVVEIEGHEVRKYVTPVVVHEGEKPKYYDVEKAISIPEIWEQVLDHALSEVNSWKVRYEHLKELSLIITAINKTQTKLQWRKSEKAQSARV